MKGIKTLIFGGLITILGGLQAADLAAFVPGEYVGIVMSVIGIVVMGLRMVTSTPALKSE